MPDVIVTGLPKAGLTLVSSLIDGLPNSVCLNSPQSHYHAIQHCPDTPFYCKWLIGDWKALRAQLLAQQPVDDIRRSDGSFPADQLYDARAAVHSGLMPSTVPFTRAGLTDSFALAIKHHTLYTSVLPSLVSLRHFTIVAVIRHPLDVFASWLKLPQPILAPGKPPGIGRFWPEAISRLTAAPDRVSGYAQLYDAYIQRYHELRDHIHIVRYEDVLRRPDIIPQMLGNLGLSRNTSLIRDNAPRIFNASDVAAFRHALQQYGLFTKFYYPDL